MKKLKLTKIKLIYFNLVLRRLIELNGGNPIKNPVKKTPDDFLTKDDFFKDLPTDEDIAFLNSWNKIEPKKED